MTDTEEAVARAICRVRFGEADGYDIWDEVGKADRISLCNEARAAIAATPLERYRVALEEIRDHPNKREMFAAWNISREALDKE